MKAGFFIDRPIFSAVLSIVIVLLGCIGLALLPVDQYPQITPPVVKISASYPGASATTVSQAVATPIEQELNGTPGMLYMESSSSNTGGLTINVTFNINTDAELAAVDIQNRVKQAESRLPAEVVQNGIAVERQSSSQLMTLCLTSSDPRFDEIYLSNFATLNVVDLLKLASLNTPDALSSSFSMLGALILGDFAVQARWLVPEVLVYMAFVAIANFAQPSFELGYALKLLRMVMLLLIAALDVWGLVLGLALFVFLLATTKPILGKGYLYPLLPFDRKALGRLLVRRPISKDNS